jgi:hypothetical protein
VAFVGRLLIGFIARTVGVRCFKMMIDKETVIKELNDFADSLTVIGGSYIRSAIRVVIEPMNESPEAAELAELKHKVAVQDAAVKKLFDAMAKEPPQIIRCKECKYWQDVKGVDGIQKKVCKRLHYEIPNGDGFCNHAERQCE